METLSASPKLPFVKPNDYQAHESIKKEVTDEEAQENDSDGYTTETETV